MSERRGSFRRRRLRAAIERLEARDVFAVEQGLSFHFAGFDAYPTPIPEAVTSFTLGGDGSSTPLGAGAVHSLTELPALSSLPGAPATLYLDFNGHVDAQWGDQSMVETPAFDQDGDPTTFTDGELATIENVFQAVSEDYAPFNINVTTVPPPSFANGAALRVAIGGDGAWLGGGYGGIAYVDSFTNSIVNTVYVFAKNLANGHAKFVADAASHEAGHGFGLDHQAAFDASGGLVAEYYAGAGDGRAPLMGNSYSSARSLWWRGPTPESAVEFQDDMSVLARAANGFGYRPDDVGDSASTASPASVSGTSLSARGVIATTGDVDVFSFVAGAGGLTIAAAPLAAYANLDVTLELRDATGSTLVAASAPTSSTGASLTVDVAAGEYRLYVASQGGYGDVGQYVISGTLVADGGSSGGGDGGGTGVGDGGGADPGDGGSSTSPVETFDSPGELAATPVASNRIDLVWQDNSNSETAVRVERSANGGRTWTRVALLPADAVRYSAVGLAANTLYQFRVTALRGLEATPASNVVAARTLAPPTRPAAPMQLRATSVQSNEVTLAWSDRSANESGFRIERSVNRGRNWILLGDVPANTTTFVDSTATPKTQFAYRVRAFNGVGVSANTNTLIVSTPAAPISGGAALPTRAAALPAYVTLAGPSPARASASASFACVVGSGVESRTSAVVQTPSAAAGLRALSARQFASAVDALFAADAFAGS